MIDVRSVPFSRWCPWFSSKPLATGLAAGGLAYLQLGNELGGRPRDPQLYCDGIADYEAAWRPEKLPGSTASSMRRGVIGCACLYSERGPLDCHRCLLVGRALGEARSDARPHPRRRHHRAACGDGGRPLHAAGGETDLFGDPPRVLPMPTDSAPARVAARRDVENRTVILYLPSAPGHTSLLHRRIPLDGLDATVYTAGAEFGGELRWADASPAWDSHFGCREHDDDDEHAVRYSLAHCRAPRRSTAVRRAVMGAAECRRPGQRYP